MRAAVSDLLLKDYNDIMEVGSIIILREVTVISQISSKSIINPKDNFYLNITSNAISTIFSLDNNDEIKTTNFSRLTKSEIQNLKTIKFSDLNKRLIVEEAETETKDIPNTKNLAASNVSGNSKNFSFKSPISSNICNNSPRSNSGSFFLRHNSKSSSFAANKFDKNNNNVPNNNNKPRMNSKIYIYNRPPPSFSEVASYFEKNVCNKTNEIKQVCNSTKSSKISNEEEIKNVLDGVDIDSLFDDF